MATVPTDDGSATDTDRARAEAVFARLAMPMPYACIPGVAANARLLERHWATLRDDGAVGV